MLFETSVESKFSRPVEAGAQEGKKEKDRIINFVHEGEVLAF